MNDPDVRHFRHVVKGDRAFNVRLEAVAQKQGLSVVALVQAHFDTILTWKAPPKRPRFDPKRFDAAAFANRHGVPLGAALLWVELRASCDDAMCVQRGLNSLAAALVSSTGVIADRTEKLLAAGLIELVRPGTRSSAAVYRVSDAE